MVKKSDTFKIPDEWSFNNPEVIEHFDRHVKESLPWYDLATGAVAQIARCYVPKYGLVVDVGASTGNIGRALAGLLTARSAKLIPIETSLEMSRAYDGPGDVVLADIEDFNFNDGDKPDLIVSFLTLMFVSVKDRIGLIQRMKAAVSIGGAIIVVDKMVPHSGYAGTVNYRLTLAAKYEAGATPEEIIKKELSISGLQRPLSAVELSGFVEFFRFGDFVGAVWEKPA